MYTLASVSEPSFPGLLGRLRCCGKYSSRDVERLSKPEEDDLHRHRREVTFPFLRSTARQVAILGATTWISMPVTTIMMWNGFTNSGYVFVAIKLGSLLAVQLHIRNQIDAAVRDHTLDIPEKPATLDLEQASSNPQSHAAIVWEWCTTIFNTIALLVLGLIRALEAIDPDSDAMTPGIAHQSDSSKDQHLFADSMTSLPFVGALLGRLGLPYVLLAGLIMVAIWQIHIFARLVKRSETEFADPVALGPRCPYALLYHMADVGNLHILSEHFKSLWRTVLAGQDPNKPIDRYQSYRARVPEMVFQGWFSVTVLVLLVRKDDFEMSRIWPVLFTIITTAVASFKSFYDMASIFRPWSTSMCEQSRDPKRAHMYQCVVNIVVCMSLHFAASAMILARFVGIWTCESHEFAIRSMRCSK